MQANTKKSHSESSNVAELYRNYASSLRLFLGRQLLVKSRTEDLVHDVFENLLRYPSIERLIRADNYIWRIAWRLVNAANRHARQDRERMAKISSEVGGWVVGLSATMTPDDMSDWLAYLEHVKQSLARLTPEERRAVLMARFGYTYEEIAARMGISIESLGTLIRRGYSILRVSAAEQEQE